MKIIIDDVPPSNNKYMGRGSKGHNFTYQNEKKKWALLIKAAAFHVKKEKIEKSVIEITYYFPTRHRRDPDNYSGKFILDGLVKCGVIADDSFSNITLILNGEYDKENPRTEIEVTEIK